MTGRVVRINREKGFGFIQPEGGGEDHFFHRSAVTKPRFDQLQEGARVSFEPGAGDKGPRAADRRAGTLTEVTGRLV